jgi:2-keto-3-deoxy-L-rhamnonate aldolase RhmA
VPGDQFTLTLWTDDPGLAARADEAGVDRVGVDLERLGKCERQRGLGTWISPHREEDLAAVRGALRSARLFARTNPPHPGLELEVTRLLALGVEVLMLPMFTSAEEVAQFVGHVQGRATVVLLLENVAAIDDLDAILSVPGVDEVHVGLNDLGLSLRLRNRYASLTSELMDRISRTVRDAGVSLGLGGIGRVHDAGLPVPSDLLYAQYARLGARSALISRVFLQPDPSRVDLVEEVGRSRARLRWWAGRGPEELADARQSLDERVAACSQW